MLEYDEQDQRATTEEVDDSEREEVGDIAHISVNAVSGVSDYTTMKVIGVQGKKTLYLLIILVLHTTSLIKMLQRSWDVH